MKIAYASDLHLEFGSKLVLERLKEVEADVLVFAGDVASVDHFVKMTNDSSPKGNFLKNMIEYANNNFKHTIFIIGNHEHYGNTYQTTAEKIKESLTPYSNVYLLDNQHLLIEDVLFYGTTMWTDMADSRPLERLKIQSSLNDFKHIRYLVGGSYKKFQPMNAATLHEVSMLNFDDTIRAYGKNKKIVLIQHHAPFFESIPEKYHSNNLNKAYYSETFEARIKENWFKQKPNLIIHGHVHNTDVYNKHGITVALNARGYEDVEDVNNFEFKVIEI